MATPTLEAGACWSLLKHYPTEWKIFYQNTTFSTQISGINLILCVGLRLLGLSVACRGRGWECHGAPHVLPPPAILLSLQPTGRPFWVCCKHFWQEFNIFGKAFLAGIQRCNIFGNTFSSKDRPWSPCYTGERVSCGCASKTYFLSSVARTARHSPAQAF